MCGEEEGGLSFVLIWLQESFTSCASSRTGGGSTADGWRSPPTSVFTVVSPQTEGPFLPTISKLTIHHRKLHFLEENKEK